RTMNTWPDGSVRTAVVTALVPGGSKELLLDIDSTAIAPAVPEGGLKLTSETAPDGTLRFQLAHGEGRVEGASGALTMDGMDAALYPETTEVLEESAVHREAEVRGRIKSGE